MVFVNWGKIVKDVRLDQKFQKYISKLPKYFYTNNIMKKYDPKDINLNIENILGIISIKNSFNS